MRNNSSKKLRAKIGLSLILFFPMFAISQIFIASFASQILIPFLHFASWIVTSILGVIVVAYLTIRKNNSFTLNDYRSFMRSCFFAFLLLVVVAIFKKQEFNFSELNQVNKIITSVPGTGVQITTDKSKILKLSTVIQNYQKNWFQTTGEIPSGSGVTFYIDDNAILQLSVNYEFKYLMKGLVFARELSNEEFEQLTSLFYGDR